VPDDRPPASPTPFTVCSSGSPGSCARPARGRLGRRAGLLLAVSKLDPSDLVDLYWAGRGHAGDQARRHPPVRRGVPPVLTSRGQPGIRSSPSCCARRLEAQGALAIPSTESRATPISEDEACWGWMASDVEALKSKSFAVCTPDELAALRRIMARIRLTPPRAEPGAPRRPVRLARVPIPADRYGSPCACTVSPRSCTGGGGRSAAAAGADPGHLPGPWRLLAQPAAVRALGERSAGGSRSSAGTG